MSACGRCGQAVGGLWRGGVEDEALVPEGGPRAGQLAGPEPGPRAYPAGSPRTGSSPQLDYDFVPETTAESPPGPWVRSPRAGVRRSVSIAPEPRARRGCVVRGRAYVVFRASLRAFRFRRA